MASDDLNEIGKYIKKTRDDADFALGRYQLRRNSVERVRDVFDSTNSFQMKFKTKKEGEKTLLDLRFDKPPPTKNWGDGCFKTTCEEFIVGPVTSIFTLKSGRYVPGTVVVFMNGELATTGSYSEYNPVAGQVRVLPGSLYSNTIIICSAPYIASQATYLEENHASSGTNFYYSYGTSAGWSGASYNRATTGAIGGTADFAGANVGNKVAWQTGEYSGTVTIYTYKHYNDTTTSGRLTLYEVNNTTPSGTILSTVRTNIIPGQNVVYGVDSGYHYWRLAEQSGAAKGFGFDGIKFLKTGDLDCQAPLPNLTTAYVCNCLLAPKPGVWSNSSAYQKVISVQDYLGLDGYGNQIGPYDHAGHPLSNILDSSTTTYGYYPDAVRGNGYYNRGFKIDMGSLSYVPNITFIGNTGATNAAPGADLYVYLDEDATTGTPIDGVWKETINGWSSTSLPTTAKKWTFYPSGQIMYGQVFNIQEKWNQGGLAYRGPMTVYGILMVVCPPV